MATTTQLLTILTLPQGHYRNLAGMTLAEALAMFCEDQAKFLREFPSCAKFWRPNWNVCHLEPGSQPGIGYEWYLAGENGTLSVYAFNHDSSD